MVRCIFSSIIDYGPFLQVVLCFAHHIISNSPSSTHIISESHYRHFYFLIRGCRPVVCCTAWLEWVMFRSTEHVSLLPYLKSHSFYNYINGMKFVFESDLKMFFAGQLWEASHSTIRAPVLSCYGQTYKTDVTKRPLQNMDRRAS